MSVPPRTRKPALSTSNEFPRNGCPSSGLKNRCSSSSAPDLDLLRTPPHASLRFLGLAIHWQSIGSSIRPSPPGRHQRRWPDILAGSPSTHRCLYRNDLEALSSSLG